MRILITGSRDWEDLEIIEEALVNHTVNAENITLVSGACPTGADRMCEEFAERQEWTVERYPADWEAHGKRAGFLRNSEMVALGADICLAFIRNNSRGATMTTKLAAKAGVGTHIFRKDD